MRPNRWLLLLFLVARCTVPLAAQTPASSWVGEWGHFEQIHTFAYPTFYGNGLSVSNCGAGGCTLSIQTSNSEAHGGASGTLQFQAPTRAVAHLSSQGKEYCTLQLTLESSPATSPAAIRVANGSGDCSYFLTPGGTFAGVYPLHTRDLFVGDNMAGCFAASAPGELALCTRKPLAAQDWQWQMLFLTVADLNAHPGSSDMLTMQAAQTAIVSRCNGAADPATCLHTALAQSSASLKQQQAAWTVTVTAPGEPGKAAQAATAIAGHYRRRFKNGDVQGNTFTSTDRLNIRILPSNAIHYDLELNFYNGHTCSLDGTATYKQAGFFVDQRKTDMPETPLCVFEIIPAKKGVKLEDPTGGCKMISCGERGGYNGAEFTFGERR